MRWGWVIACACAGALVVGCGDDAAPAPAADAGVDAGYQPEAPRIPWLDTSALPIAITPCPSGWREVADGDVTVCEPYPEAGPETCKEGSTHFPGGTGCEPVGAACPAGDWPDDLPTSGVVYVRAGAAAGDGSAAAPFGRIADAMRVASAGDTIALAPGRYDEIVRVTSGVTLRGACSAQTVLTSSIASETAPVVYLPAGNPAIRDLRVEGAERPGVFVVGGAADARMEGVVITGVRMAALVVADGAHLAAHDLAIHDVRSRASDLTIARAIDVQGAASAEITRIVIDRARDTAIAVDMAGSSLVLEDAVVRETLPRESSRSNGMGILITRGATAELRRTLIDGNRTIGVATDQPGTTVTLESCIIRSTESRESDLTLGHGLRVQLGAAVTAVRTLIDGNRGGGALVGGDGSSLELADVVVRDTRSYESDSAGGRGLEAQTGATLHGARVASLRNRDLAIHVDGAGTVLQLEDVVLRDTGPDERDASSGRGLNVQNGAVVTLERALFERNQEFAVFANNPGSNVTLTDVVIRDTRESAMLGNFGRALEVQDGAVVEVSRAVLERNRQATVFAYGEGSVIRGTEVMVRDTLEAACAASCPSGSGGMGVASIMGGSVALTHFAIRRSVLCGVMVATGGGIDLAMGEVSGAMIGACIQIDGYDFSRLQSNVEYLDNGTPLAATMLPVPEAR